MEIIEFLDKSEQIQVRMLSDILDNGGSIDIKYLLKKYSLSYNTTVSYLTDIIECSRYYGSKIKWEMEQTKIKIITKSNFSIFELYGKYLKESINIKLISEIAFSSNQTSVSLAHKLDMSDSSVNRRIKQINQKLASFGISIKANNFTGDEFKIRLFLFQLFSIIDLKTNKQSEHSLQSKVEKIIYLNEQGYLNRDLTNWLSICNKRRFIRKETSFECQISEEEREKMQLTSLFKQINELLIISVNDLNKNESIYLYLFILIYIPLNINSARQYKFIIESFQLNEQVDKQTKSLIGLLKMEKNNKILVNDHFEELYYELNRIHMLEFYTRGFCNFSNVINRAKNYLIAENYNLDLLVTDMMDKLEEMSIHPISESLKSIIYSRYTLLLYHLNFNQIQLISIGIDVQSDIRIPTELEVQTFEMPNSNVKIQSEEVNKNICYDLVITDDFFDTKEFNSKKVYKLNGFKLDFDRTRIMEVLKEIHFEEVKKIQQRRSR